MTLTEIASLYLADRVCCGAYAHHVRKIAGRCGEPTAARINAYLKARVEKVSTITVRNERTIILSLCKYAWERDMIDGVKGVMRIKARRAPTRAWTVEQLRLALAAADSSKRRLRSGAPVSEFLRAWMLLGYETGARFGDLMAFRAANIDGDTIRWTQSKTGDGIAKHMSPACRAAVSRMLARSPDGRILGWACKRRQAARIMRSHLDECGIGGTSKWLRRSGATHIEMEQPGKAPLHLGHRTPTLAAQAYIDWGQVRKTTPSTPELWTEH
jgi:integrase